MPQTKKTAKKPQNKIQAVLAGTRQKISTYRGKRPHRTFKLTRLARHKLGGKRLGRIMPLIWDTYKTIWQERRILLGLAAIYAVASYIVVGGISQVDFVDLKDATTQVFQGHLDAIGNAVTLFGSAMSGVLNQQPNQIQQVLGVMLGIVFWLSLIWALRMRFAKEKIKVRDALYNSSAPLVPSLLVALTIIVQLLPAAVGMIVMATALSLGSLQGSIEYITFAFGAGLLLLLSLYWVVASALALVIVTLPQMYPWRALSTASELVIGQRWKLVFRVVLLFAVNTVTWAVVLLPVLLLDGWLRFDWLPLVPITVQALTAVTLVYTATYIYKLYRSLL